MSRLIDADDLKKIAYQLDKEMKEKINKNDYKIEKILYEFIHEIYYTMIKIIDKMPTKGYLDDGK